MNAEKPVINPSQLITDESIETHPAYGQIAASRVNGQARLYGSDFLHHNYMTIKIQGSELHRGLSRDWAFARKVIVEVALSEAQWATFVSTPNSGGGTQCTLQYAIDRGDVPRIAQTVDRKKQFAREHSNSMKESITQLNMLRGTINGLKISEKQKKAIMSDIDVVTMGVSSSLGFIANQFGEYMEKVAEDAKIEVNAYIEGSIQRAGLAAIKAGDAPLSLPDNTV